jgi:hypothetical protein
MERLLSKDISNFNLVDSNEVRKAWILYRDYINAFLHKLPALAPELSSDDLDENGFYEFKNYKFHPALIDLDGPNDWFSFLIKAAMFEVYENTTGINLSHFLYQKDKVCNRAPRGISDDIYDRFDRFKCGIESGNIIRHFGTAIGAEAYAKEPKNRARSSKNGLKRRSGFRASNKEFLRGLTYGFTHENENRLLVCPMDGSKIEGIYTFCENSDSLVTSDCYEIHHAKYDQIGSFYKSTSPSSYLNTEDFTEFSQEVIEEFLGCIILSQSSHTRIHHTHKVDGINNWLNRVNSGRCIFIPYHWRNELCYLKTLAVLEEKCKKFVASNALSYADFLNKHCSTRHRE